MAENLRDLLKRELKDLHGSQVTKFKAELGKRLPIVIKEAGKEAKKGDEKGQVKNNKGGLSENVR